MIRPQNIENFVNFGYVPFSKPQCIKRLLILWGIGLAVAMIGLDNPGWIITACCINAFVSFLFSLLLFKRTVTKKARFICDGVFWTCISIFLCIAAYRVMVFRIGSNWLLLAILLGLLLICIALFVVIVFLSIAKDTYAAQTKQRSIIITPFVAGLSGMVVAGLFLRNATQDTLIMILSLLLLLLAFLTSIGSVNLLKALLAGNQTETT